MHNVLNLDLWNVCLGYYKWEKILRFILVQITVDQMKAFTVNWRLWEAGWTGGKTTKQSVRWIIKKQRRLAQTVQQNKDEWTPGSFPGVQSRETRENMRQNNTTQRGEQQKVRNTRESKSVRKLEEEKKKADCGKARWRTTKTARLWERED